MIAAHDAGKLLDPTALARLKGLVLRSRRVVDGVLQGIHRSPHQGSSIEFSEHKEYSPGEEIRHIDWKAFGRLDKYYVKKYEQESNLRAYFVIDCSGSMGYGRDGGLTKLEYASVLAVSLSYLLLGQQDAVGLVIFADEVIEVLPPRARTTHLAHICSVLEQVTPNGGTDLDRGIRRVHEIATKRGQVFVLSDFFDEQASTFTMLRQLVSRGHEVTAFHMLDGDELEFPFEEMSLFEGMEDRRRLLVEPRLVRDVYLKRLEAHRSSVRERCLKGRVDYVFVDTREPPDRLLLSWLTRRETSRAVDWQA